MRHHEVGAWISEGADIIDEFVSKHFEVWAQGACEVGFCARTVADVQDACEATIRRGPSLFGWDQVAWHSSLEWV